MKKIIENIFLTIGISIIILGIILFVALEVKVQNRWTEYEHNYYCELRGE